MSLTKSEVRAQLQRLLDSPDFKATPQRREFLSYIVEESLAGREGKNDTKVFTDFATWAGHRCVAVQHTG